MSDLTKRLEALSAEQAALLERELRKRRGRLPADQPAGAAAVAAPVQTESATPAPPGRADRRAAAEMKFSLFFFSDDGSKVSRDNYRLLLHGARYADEHGFEAVWTPERHFHPFGGLYPNPAVLAAALAVSTRRVRIRAGSVVLPLHNPLRVAEEWAVVDNLSGGRIDLSFASGWHPDDFVLFPGNYENRREVLWQSLEIVRRLWRGEVVDWPGVRGPSLILQTFPRPIQRELPVWVTSSGDVQTWIRAGTCGANVLTALLTQSLEELKDRIAVYRETRARHGHSPDAGEVTVMLHAFVGDDLERVKETVQKPLCQYLRTHLGLFENLLKSENLKIDINTFSEQDRDALIGFAFQRYFNTSSLLGTRQTCAEMVRRLKAIGVTEIGCLIDFGVEVNLVLDSLERLDGLRRDFAPGGCP
jgi:natural product biosynthesis luciferase-like monooxygenase protein